MGPERRQSADARHSARDAVPADVDRVAEIKVRNWADTYGPLIPSESLRPFVDRDKSVSQIRELMRSPDTLLLVVPGAGMVQGFALTHMARSPEPWLESLHVMREARGLGLGTLLIRETVNRLLAEGYRSLSLGVILGNDGASKFYEHLGAVAVRVEPVDFADGVEHTVWRWPDLTRLALDRPLAGA
jgi:ribosomal protein S18 acetylase RimI-like enzyme